MTFEEIINSSGRIVFFGGAGVSTESGIPDFRSADGLYNQNYRYPPETILSHSFFESHPEEFFKFYKEKMIFTSAKPNITHTMLARLEKIGKLSAVITQNIDGLHQAAGSKTVYELHGSVHKNHCVKCHKPYGLDKILASKGVPVCSCGGIIKPDVVLYEEPLDDTCVKNAVCAIENADALIIGGTSLNVYPAAGFVRYYSSDKLVIINKSPTAYDNLANLVINDSLGNVFSKIKI